MSEFPLRLLHLPRRLLVIVIVPADFGPKLFQSVSKFAILGLLPPCRPCLLGLVRFAQRINDEHVFVLAHLLDVLHALFLLLSPGPIRLAILVSSLQKLLPGRVLPL